VPAAIYCNRCGHRNQPGSNFCASCGARLEPPRDDNTIVLPAVDPAQDSILPDDDVVLDLGTVPSTGAVLLVRSGPEAGMTVPLTAQITRAGRHPRSEIFLDDVTVSRRHVEIERTAKGYVVRDVGSLNGTYLNRQRIDESVLQDGDELQIGKFRLVFVAGEAAAGRA
jgi:pSer/pThr/pTyr-binding forkhead associated (FHA) protein